MEVQADINYELTSLTVNDVSIKDSLSFKIEEVTTYFIDAKFTKKKEEAKVGTISFTNLNNGPLNLSLDNLVLDNLEVSSVYSSNCFCDDESSFDEFRLSVSKSGGNVTFNFADEITVSKVEIDMRQYHEDNSLVTVSLSSSSLSQNYQDNVFEFDNEVTSSLQISSSAKNRVIISNIYIYFEEEEIVPTPAYIDVNPIEFGKVSISPSSNWMLGDTITIKAIPDEGYYLSSLTLNGQVGKYISLNTYSFKLKEVNNIVDASFKLKGQSQNDFSYLYANTAIFPDRGNQNVDIDSYYEPIRGLKGEELKKGLHEIIDDHVEFSYDDLGQSDWEYVDEDPFNSNNFYVTYQGSTPKGYKVNKEHTWAKSHGNFGESKPAGSDLHNLRGAYTNLNSTRGNLDFGEVEHNSLTSVMKYSWASDDMEGNYVDYSSYFEPKDEFKGDVARIIFYMATRYEGDGEPQLEVGGQIDETKYYNFTYNASGLHGNFADLYKWATSDIDPVSDYEVSRNNRVDQDYQHNRNPFIDHPEFIIMIYDKSYSGPGALNE